MNVTLDQYFGTYAKHPDATPGKWAVADVMLDRVNRMLEYACECGLILAINPHTNSLVSGETNGGFRPMNCPVGAPASKHKMARAVDVYDPGNRLDDWLTTFDSEDGKRNSMLEKYGLWRESPDDTETWLHLQDLPPKSGRRTFRP